MVTPDKLSPIKAISIIRRIPRIKNVLDNRNRKLPRTTLCFLLTTIRLNIFNPYHYLRETLLYNETLSPTSTIWRILEIIRVEDLPEICTIKPIADGSFSIFELLFLYIR